MDSIAPFRITVCGIDELPEHCEIGVSHVLSILDPDRAVPDAFGSYGAHERLELRFHDVIDETPGNMAPQPEHVAQLLGFGRNLMAEPAPAAHLLVHCHAGISRSSASMALILAQALPEQPADAILAEVLRIRPQAWPNLRIIEMGDALLGRGGAMVSAAHRVYGLQLGRRPDLVEEMYGWGRAREIEAGRASAGV
jgi:predicted protein tyrosine phosphatase